MWPFFSFPKDKSSLGAWGEQIGSEYYRKRGYTTVSRNEFNRKGLRVGEIDFIATTKSDIAFVEVKTRSGGGGKFGAGADAVHYSKQQKLLKAVHGFLVRRPEFVALRPHIDVCVIELQSLDRKLYSVTIIENSVEDWQ